MTSSGSGGAEEMPSADEGSYSALPFPETVFFLNEEVNKDPFINEGKGQEDMVYCWNQECKDAEIEFKYWLESESWHKDRKIMWKRSFCLHGPPGTGKTSFVRYLGHKYGMPIISFDLATFKNSEFSEEWSSAINNHSPCIFLIEDIDAVFDGRENTCNKNSLQQMLTFDCLLNCLDGIENNDGTFLIITTNHIEKLDPALLRSGRVDKKIRIGNMIKEQRLQLAEKIIDHLDKVSVKKLVEETEGMTAADVSRHFVEIALDHHWKGFSDSPINSEKIPVNKVLVSNSIKEKITA